MARSFIRQQQQQLALQSCSTDVVLILGTWYLTLVYKGCVGVRYAVSVLVSMVLSGVILIYILKWRPTGAHPRSQFHPPPAFESVSFTPFIWILQLLELLDLFSLELCSNYVRFPIIKTNSNHAGFTVQRYTGLSLQTGETVELRPQLKPFFLLLSWHLWLKTLSFKIKKNAHIDKTVDLLKRSLELFSKKILQLKKIRQNSRNGRSILKRCATGEGLFCFANRQQWCNDPTWG